MTIASATSRISYTGDGATTAFAVPFYFQSNSDIIVSLQDTSGNQSVQLIGTSYNLTGATVSTGGTCTFTTAPTSGSLVTIYRDPPVTQTTSYNNNDPFPAKSHELALDKLTTIAQRAKDQVSRSIHQTEGEAVMTTELASIANRKNKLLGFDGNGGLIYAVGPTFVGNTSTGVAEVDSRATAQTLTFAASVTVIQTHGLASPGDGGGADYTIGTIASPGAFQDASGAYWGLVSSPTVVGAPQARLTLTTGVAVTTSDVTGATTVYYTPTGGNQVPIYNGVSMVPTTIVELSLALDNTAAHTGYQQSGFNFDCFVINDASTIRLGTGPSWAAGVAGSDTARGTGAGSTELQLINGLWTNKNTITIRFGSASGNTVSVPANKATYVGTFRTTADGVTEDSLVKRFLYNAYNQARRPMLRQEPTASWTYSTATYRQAFANPANQLAYVAGLAGSSLEVTATSIPLNSTSTTRIVYTGVGIDSTTVNGRTIGDFARVADGTVPSPNPKAFYSGVAKLGYHYVAWLEKGNGTDVQTWFGTTADYQSGIFGSVFN